MLGSHVGKIVIGALLAAAAAVGILAGLTTLVGLPVALGAMILLIVVAVGVGFVTRPERQPPEGAELSPQPPKAQADTPEGPIPHKLSFESGSTARKEPLGLSTPSPASSLSPESKSPAKRVQVTPAPGRSAKVSIAPSERLLRLGAAYREAQSKPSTPPGPAAQQPRPFKETLVLKKSFEVEAGKITNVKLEFVKGDYVYGQLKEVDGYEFTWAIVNLTGLGLMERRLRFPVQRGEMDVSTATVEWIVPSDGPWFLAFDAYKKQYVRQVSVELWQRLPQ